VVAQKLDQNFPSMLTPQHSVCRGCSFRGLSVVMTRDSTEAELLALLDTVNCCFGATIAATDTTNIHNMQCRGKAMEYGQTEVCVSAHFGYSAPSG